MYSTDSFDGGERYIYSESQTITDRDFNNHLRYTLKSAIRLSHIYRFNSLPDMYIEDKFSENSESIHTVDKFEDFMCTLSSYFALIINNGNRNKITVITRNYNLINGEKVTKLGIYSLDDFCDIYSQVKIYISFRSALYTYTLPRIIRTFCLGEPGIARYIGINDTSDHMSSYLNIWEHKIEFPNNLPPPDPKLIDYVKLSFGYNTDDNYNFVLNWLINLYQKHYVRIKTCPIFVGDNINDIFLRMFGEHIHGNRFCRIGDREQIFGKDNKILIGKSLVMLDETCCQGEFTNKLEPLRNIITSNHISVHVNGEMDIISNCNFFILTKSINDITNIDTNYFPIIPVADYNISNIKKLLTNIQIQQFLSWLGNQNISNIDDIKPLPVYIEQNVDEELTPFEVLLEKLELNIMLDDPERPNYGINFVDIYSKYCSLLKDDITIPHMSKRELYKELREYYNDSNERDFIARSRGNRNHLERRFK